MPVKSYNENSHASLFIYRTSFVQDIEKLVITRQFANYMLYRAEYF